MVEELQSLLDRIQKDGVEQAQAQADRIVAEAEERARAIVSDGERRAAEALAKADQDAHVFTERSTKTLEQVARDFLLGIKRDIESVFRESVNGVVGEALTPETMNEMLINMARAYGSSNLKETRIELLLSPEDQEVFVNQFLNRYREALGKGITVHADKTTRRGFKVSLKDDKLYHDFTQQAIADSVMGLLKAPLDEIVKKAAANAEESS
jgi:V/A-type H+-transporting ATPase subunit E